MTGNENHCTDGLNDDKYDNNYQNDLDKYYFGFSFL